MKRQYLYIGLLLLSGMAIFLFSSFKLDIETTFTTEEMQEINQEADAIVAAFVKKEKNQCRRELMEIVVTRVDTILMFDVRKLLREKGTLINDAPPRPTPPDRPELLTPDDDTPLRPLIENEEKVFQKQDSITSGKN